MRSRIQGELYPSTIHLKIIVRQSAGPSNADHICVHLRRAHCIKSGRSVSGAEQLQMPAGRLPEIHWRCGHRSLRRETLDGCYRLLHTTGVREAIASNIVKGKPSGYSLRLGTTTTSALAIFSMTSVFAIITMKDSKYETPSSSPSAFIAAISPPPASEQWTSKP